MPTVHGVFGRKEKSDKRIPINSNKLALKESLGSTALEEFLLTQYDMSDPSFDANKTADDMVRMSDGSLTGQLWLDVETVGNNITEVGYIEYGMENGVPQKKDAYTAVLGLRPDAETDELIKSAKRKARYEPHNLNSTEKSILQRLSLFAGNNTDRVETVNGITAIKSLAESRPLDLDAVEQGERNLRAIYESNKQGYMKTMNTMADKVNTYASDPTKITAGYNSTAFDMNIIKSNLKAIGSNKALNTSNHVDAFHIAKLGTQGSSARYIEKLGGTITGGVDYRNESAMKAIGDDSVAHIAINDIEGSVNALYSNVATVEGEFKPLVSQLLEEVNNGVRKQSISSNQAVRVVQAKKSIAQGPIDYVEQLINGEFKQREFGDWGLRRGQFYSVNNMKHVSYDVLKDTGAINALIANGKTHEQLTNGMWAMELESAVPGVGVHEKVTLFRDTPQEFQKFMQNNLGVIEEGSKAFLEMDKIQAQFVADNSRRTLQGMFEEGTRGFSFAKESYGTFNVLQDALRDLGFNGLITSDNVKELYKYGTIDGVDYSKAKQAINLSSIEREIAFLDSVNVLRDTNEFMTPIVRSIDSNKAYEGMSEAGGNIQKTLALRSAYDSAIDTAIRTDKTLGYELEIAAQLMNNETLDINEAKKKAYDNLDSIVRNYVAHRDNWDDRSVVQLDIEGKLFNLQVGNPNDTRQSIWNIANQLIDKGAKQNSSLQIDETKRAIVKIYETLKSQDLLNSNVPLYDEKYIPSPNAMVNSLQGLIDKHVPKGNHIIDPMKAFSLDGSNVYGMPFSQYMTEKVGLNPVNVAEQAVTRTKYVANISIGDGYNRFDSKIRDTLKDVYHYTDDNVSALESVLYDKNRGLVSAQGLGVTMFDKEGRLHFAVSKFNAINNVTAAITKGEDITNAAVIRMPELIEYAGGEGTPAFTVVKNGSLQRLQSNSMSFYVDRENNPRFKTRDTMTDSIESIKMVARRVADNVNSGQYDRASSAANNAITNIMMKQGTAVGGGIDHIDDMYDQIDDTDFIGSMKKSVRMTPYDTIMARHTLRVQELVNIMPYLYETDTNFRSYLNSEEIGYGPKEMEKIMTRMRDGIHNGEKYTPDNLMGKQVLSEFWVTHLNIPNEGLNGRSIFDIIQQNAKKISANTSFDFEAFMMGVDKANFSQIGKDVHVSEGIAYSENILKYIPHGVYNGYSRPLVRQFLSGDTINLDNINKDPERLQALETFSEDVNVKPYSFAVTDVYKNDIIQRYGEGYEQGVTATLRNMNDADLLEVSRKLFGDYSADVIPEEVIKYAESISQDPATVHEMVKRYQMHLSTYEQHGIAHPDVMKVLYPEKELKNVSFDPKVFKDMDVVVESLIKTNKVFVQGEEIMSQEVMNKDGSSYIKTLMYDHHSPGSIVNVDMERGTYGINPVNKNYDAIKAVTPTEKWTLSGIMGKTAEEHYISKQIFTSIAGEGVMGVSFAESGKHLARGDVFGSSLNTMGEIAALIAEDTGDTSVISEFEKMVNDRMPYENIRISKENDKAYRMVVESMPDKPGANQLQFSEAIKVIEENFNNSRLANSEDLLSTSAKRTYSALMDVLKDPTLTRTLITKGQSSEQLSVMNEDTGKGVKWEVRIDQITGLNADDDIRGFFEYNERSGKFEKTLKPYLDKMWDYVRSSNEYKEAKDVIGNTVNALRGNAGVEMTARVKSTSLDSIGLVSRATEYEDLVGTVFSDSKTDVFEINIKNGGKVTNALTGQMSDKVYIPKLSPLYVNGKMIQTESTRAVTNFLNDLKDFENMKLDPGRADTAQEAIDNSFNRMLSAMSFDLSGHKDSMISRKVMSGRLNNSGFGMSTVISPTLTNELGELIHPAAKGVIKDGRYNAVSVMSIDGLKKMGVDFGELGDFVKKNNFFEDMDMFKGSSSLFNDSMSNYDIGLKWAENIGVPTAKARFPVMRGKSDIMTLTRVDKSLRGLEEFTDPVVAALLNLDSDGDIIANIIMANRTGTGAYDRNDWSAFAKVYEAQQTEFMKEFAVVKENYDNKHQSSNINRDAVGDDVDQFLRQVNGLSDDTDVRALMREGVLSENLALDVGAKLAAVRASQTKAAIGFVSNKNLLIRDVAENFYTKGDAEHMGEYGKTIVNLFTTRTEQQLIDTKYLKENKYSKAEIYGKTINKIFSNDPTVRAQGLTALGTQHVVGNLFTPEEMGSITSELKRMGDDAATRASYADNRRTNMQKGKFDPGAIKTLIAPNNVSGLSSIQDLRFSEIESASDKGLFVGDKQLRIGDTVAFSSKSGNIAPGVYEYMGHSTGGTSGIAILNLANIDGSEVNVPFGSVSEIQTRISNGEVIGGHAIIDKTKEITEKIYQDYTSYASKGINEYYRTVAATGAGASQAQAAAFERISSDIALDNGALETFLKKTEVMTQKGNISTSIRSDMLSQMNAYVKENGLSATKEFGDKLLFEGANKAAEEYAYNPNRVPSGINVQKFIENIDVTAYKPKSDMALETLNNIKHINPEQLESELQSYISKAKRGLTPFEKRAIGSEAELDRIINTKISNKVKAAISTTEQDANRTARQAYNTLAYEQTEQGIQALNWSTNGSVESMGSQKISFGDYAGMQFNEVELNQLKELMAQPTDGLGDVERASLEATQSRISDYMSVLNNSNAEHIPMKFEMASSSLEEVLTSRAVMLPADGSDLIRGAAKIAPEVSPAIGKGVKRSMTGIDSVFGKASGALSDIKGPGIGIALGVAGAASVAILAQQTAKPGPINPENRGNGSGNAPTPDGRYEDNNQYEQSSMPHMNEKTIRLDDSPSMKYIIKAKGNDVDPNVLASQLGQAAGSNNVNVRLTDDRMELTGSWLDQTMSNLLIK